MKRFTSLLGRRDGMRATRRATRFAIFERDGWTCVYCGRDVSGMSRRNRMRLLTLDHALPASRGGLDTDANLVTACTACNAAKAARTLKEWKGALSEEVKL